MSAPALPRVRETAVPNRFADFWELTKPGIGLMVVLTAAASAALASPLEIDRNKIIHAAVGTGLLSAGAATLNHWRERLVDRRMKRTARRPMAAGRIEPPEGFWFGVTLVTIGAGYLAAFASLLPAFLGLISAILYVCVYTPMKEISAWNTVVGAIPGALPVLIGWTVVKPELDAVAWLVFAILFVWQFPHFFAIAWIYRDDYENAGIKMFPATAVGRRYTALQAMACCALLLSITLAPPLLRLGGPIYGLGALACGLYFLSYAIAFMREETPKRAKMLMFSSLIYLPAVLGLLVVSAVGRG